VLLLQLLFFIKWWSRDIHREYTIDGLSNVIIGQYVGIADTCSVFEIGLLVWGLHSGEYRITVCLDVTYNFVAGVHKTQLLGHVGDEILYDGAKYLWVLCTQFTACYTSVTCNFEMASRFWKICAPLVLKTSWMWLVRGIISDMFHVDCIIGVISGTCFSLSLGS